MSNTRVTHWSETKMYIKKGIGDTLTYTGLTADGELAATDDEHRIRDITDFGELAESPTINSWTPAGDEEMSYFIGATGLPEWSVTVKYNDSDDVHLELESLKKRDVVEMCAHAPEGTGKINYYQMIFAGRSDQFISDDVTEATYMFQVTARKMNLRGS